MENLPDFEKQIAGMIRELATAFTVNHAALKISVQPLASRTVINVTPHIDDYGKMVGTSGVRVNALKTIVNAFALRHQRRVSFVLLKPEGVESKERPKFKADPNWKADASLALLKNTLGLLFSAPEVHAEDSGDTTALIAKVSKGDALADLCYEIGDALDTIFAAIGKAQGRNILGVDLNAL